MKKIIYCAGLLSICALSVAACSRKGPQAMPNIIGRAGEMLVVMDKAAWDDTSGRAIRQVLAAEYPAIPQPEPMFDLVHLVPNAFTRFFEPHRNILVVKTAAGQSETKMTSRHDVHAAPQTVVTLSGANADSIAALTLRETAKLRGYFEQAERGRVVENARRYQDVNLSATVRQLFGGTPAFPQGYTIRKQAEQFIWMEYNTRQALQGFLIFSYPYRHKTDFEPAKMIAAHNEILKAQVPSGPEGSYMQIWTVLPPEVRFLKYNNLHFASMRGLWDVEKGFMGGPFVSHSYLHPDGKNIVVVLAFVFAPNEKKRNLMRQTESIGYSFEWAERGQ